MSAEEQVKQQAAADKKAAEKAAKAAPLVAFLAKLGLADFAPKFEAEDLLLVHLAGLSDDNLKDLGLTMGQRQMIRDALAAPDQVAGDSAASGVTAGVSAMHLGSVGDDMITQLKARLRSVENDGSVKITTPLYGVLDAPLKSLEECLQVSAGSGHMCGVWWTCGVHHSRHQFFSSAHAFSPDPRPQRLLPKGV